MTVVPWGAVYLQLSPRKDQAMTNDEKKDKKVEVTVDRKKHHVRPGDWRVSDFKAEVKVEPGYDLDQVINGQFMPLDNGATITIHGGEVFVSHVPQGGSA